MGKAMKVKAGIVLRHWTQFAVFAAAALSMSLTAIPAVQAATLTAGAGQQYKTPSEAIGAAKAGDTVKIIPGTYFDCAVLAADNLTVEGTGPGAILTDKTCNGKALFVVDGTNITIRNLTFQRARVPDGNGAGIRAEGTNLTIENSQFINNQDGILTSDNPKSSLIIRNSKFDHNGNCTGACAHGVYAGNLALLEIDNSQFIDTLEAHHIKSRALRTVLTNNHIEDGPDGTASYEVDIPNGGSLVMTGNILEKGPKNENHTAAIMIGEEGISQPTDELVFKNNVFTNDGPPTAFIKSITATPAQLIGNKFNGHSITPLIGDGSVH